MATSAAAIVVLTASVKKSDAEARAAKLARGKQISWSSGCIDCHTPGTFYGTPDTTRLFSGSELGWEGAWGVTYPRNLTPDPETGIASWTEQDIVNAVRLGHRPDQTPILPPMPWPAYSQMSDDDVYALAAYLKSIPPVKHRSPDRIPPGVKATGPRLTFPAPPEWDGRNLPKAPDEEVATK
jgi:mono/diheme cytochrome c family protein